VQLTHGGRRERWDMSNWLPTFAPSCRRELIHGSFPVEMEDNDIARTVRGFADAARRARDGGVDGVEISCQAGTLIEQFWSPAMNFRDDDYGGSLENRMRFGLEVLEAVRGSVGDDYVVGIRMPGDEMLKDGLSGDDCVEIARAYAASGLVDFISVVGGQATTLKDEARIWPTMWVPSAAYLKLAKAVRDAVAIPIFHATRITDAATAEYAVKEGYVDMVGMTRAFIADPHHVNKLKAGREAEIRPCVGVGYCVDRVISGHDAVCAHNVAAGRELVLPQIVTPSTGARRKVVVVGAGPGGLEAARVSAARGHEVVLFEAASELGGQLLLAARATWRRDLSGISRWLAAEMDRLGVDVRLNAYAESADVLDEAPDTVVIATGGLPNVGVFDGADLAVTSWDILSGAAAPGATVLLFDEHGSYSGLSCAEHLGAAGSKVVFATPERSPGRELGGTSLGAYMNELYRYETDIRPDTRLLSVRRAGNRLAATLANIYSDAACEIEVDQVVGETATLPNTDLYFELKPLSSNLGEVDLDAMARFEPPAVDRNAQGAFTLFRIGDAWTSRNMHAAMLDAMRVCKDL
jgi:2,4-dienoyl-CoA reductase-like NADH-dependent reductase (Old Yellow Enzyme family)